MIQDILHRLESLQEEMSGIREELVNTLKESFDLKSLKMEEAADFLGDAGGEEEQEESMHEGVGGLTVVFDHKEKTENLDDTDADEGIDITHYKVMLNGKQVGEIQRNEYFGNVTGEMFNKSLPDLKSYVGKDGASAQSGPQGLLHRFLKTATGQKWASRVPELKNILSNLKEVTDDQISGEVKSQEEQLRKGQKGGKPEVGDAGDGEEEQEEEYAGDDQEQQQEGEEDEDPADDSEEDMDSDEIGGDEEGEVESDDEGEGDDDGDDEPDDDGDDDGEGEEEEPSDAETEVSPNGMVPPEEAEGEGRVEEENDTSETEKDFSTVKIGDKFRLPNSDNQTFVKKSETEYTVDSEDPKIQQKSKSVIMNPKSKVIGVPKTDTVSAEKSSPDGTEGDSSKAKTQGTQTSQDSKNVNSSKVAQPQLEEESTKKSNKKTVDLTGVAAKEGISAQDVDSKQLEKGKRIEMEHTNDASLAEKIALDHLAEIPDYYDRLERMEKEATAAKDAPEEPKKKETPEEPEEKAPVDDKEPEQAPEGDDDETEEPKKKEKAMNESSLDNLVNTMILGALGNIEKSKSKK
jgi:hypothetical protein